MISPKQIELMLHSLGLTNSKKSYRNHFAAAPNTDDHIEILKLVELGFMKKGGILNEGESLLIVYHVTKSGQEELDKYRKAFV